MTEVTVTMPLQLTREMIQAVREKVNMLMKHVHSERRIELDPRIGEYVYVVTTTAKTNAERQREFRARKATEQQATEVRGIFAHPDDHAPIKEHAAKLARKRTKAVQKNHHTPG